MKDIGHVRADRKPSEHAMGKLRAISISPLPAQEVNFTVRDKLLQFEYVTMEGRTSPYITHKPGRKVPHLVITPAGRKALQEHVNAARARVR